VHGRRECNHSTCHAIAQGGNTPESWRLDLGHSAVMAAIHRQLAWQTFSLRGAAGNGRLYRTGFSDERCVLPQQAGRNVDGEPQNGRVEHEPYH